MGRSLTYRLTAFLVTLSMLLTSIAPVAQAQEGSGSIWLPLVGSGQNASAVPSSDLLYRAEITVDSPTRRQRLDELGLVILSEEGQTVTVLVDAEQLADLARLRFTPGNINEVSQMVRAGEKAWLTRSLLPLLESAARVGSLDMFEEGASARVSRAAALVDVRTAARSLSAAQRAGLAELPSLDDDGDGLTNTEESWWCTDPLNPDSNGNGVSDGESVARLLQWLRNERSGPPVSGAPFKGWPMVPGDGNFNPNCVDVDRDSVPDLAELYMLGLHPRRESTSRDKFDDGQKLYGITAWDWGALPRVQDTDYIFAEMPAWVRSPGKHPFVAAYPVPVVELVESSLKVETVTNITTNYAISNGTERSYITAKTVGTETSRTDTQTWNHWEEISIASPHSTRSIAQGPVESFHPYERLGKAAILMGTGWTGIVKGCMAGALAGPKGCAVGAVIGLATIGWSTWELAGALKDIGEQNRGEQAQCRVPENQLRTNSISSCIPQGHVIVGTDGISSLSTYTGRHNQDRSHGNSVTSVVHDQATQVTEASKYQQISYPILQPVPMRTETTGTSIGGAYSTTTSEYQEHTISNGEAFSSGESWAIATAVNSAHAANLRFTYSVRNVGTDYAKEIGNLVFNIYIGEDPNPAYTYHVAPDLGGTGVFKNFIPGEEHKYTSRPIPLSLEQLRVLDIGDADQCLRMRAEGEIPTWEDGGRCSGGEIRIVVEGFSYGSEDFFQDAVDSSVLIAIEDGTDDGDEAIDTYLLPTWGEETVLDVMARYFPHTVDENGMMIAIWTPEYGRTDTPAWCDQPRVVGSGNQRTLWCRRALSTADWWNIYTNGMGDGTEGLQNTPASPGSTVLFRFNKDSDLDGYSDRSEIRLGTDPFDPSDFPRPELLAGLNSVRANDRVVATLSLLNTGLYDAYGVEAVMIAPDDSVTIVNNMVGGSGRVRAQNQVIVGSRIALQTPLPAAWLQTGHAQPSAGGYYTGSKDRTYTFTVQCATTGGCSVGSGTWTLAWDDGNGASGSLNFGEGYQSPTMLNVGDLGLTLSMLSGTVSNNERFTLDARTPRDTFQYTINREPYTEPIVIVSYNDPQGNHRFILPPDAANLTTPTDNLAAFRDSMLADVGVEIVTTEAYDGGTATTNLLVNNPSETTLVDAYLFMNFINISGTVVSEVSTQVTLPPGPTIASITWDGAAFNPAYSPDEDYIVLVFLTDYQGNILDTSGRPLSSFQEDPRARSAMDASTQIWDFGAAQQGTLLQHQFALASIGYMDLLTYLGSAPGLTAIGPGESSILPGDVAIYTVQLNTEHLPVGPYEAVIPVRTSDAQNPVADLIVRGSVTAGPADVPGGAVLRPLDVDAVISGNQSAGTWVEFTHNLGPDSQSLHPVKVYSQDYGTLHGVGKYATDFGAGAASADMFGDGRDGVMPGSGNLDNNNGFAAGSVNGTVGATSISVTDRHAIARVNPGDVVLIHQTRGSGAGQWELNKAVSNFTGSGTFALEKPLKYNYISNGGNEKAQILRVPQYSTCNVTGTVTPLSAWNGDWGGIFAVMCNGTMTVTASISAFGMGFRGGIGKTHSGTATQGEGLSGTGLISTGANGIGGGAGGGQPDAGSAGAGGGGGGHATPGAAGRRQNGIAGSGGSTGSDNADLTLAHFGGGAGGGANDYLGGASAGGAGGGLMFVFAQEITVTGSINARGAQGGTGTEYAEGGNGAGGAILIKTRDGTLGNSLVLATGNSNTYGGSGGAGRIRLEYCGSLTGTTNPIASTQKLDCHIVEQIETAPYNTARLNLPETFPDGRTYAVQYGRQILFQGGDSYGQATTLRLPKQLYSDATLDALISSAVSSNPFVFSIDIGNNGTADWSHNAVTSFPVVLNMTGLVNALNAYLVSRNDIAWGAEVDVPVRVVSDRQADMLLTNLVLRLQVNQPAVSRAGEIEIAADRPLDWPLQVVGNYSQGTQIEFTHTLGPDPESLHPCLVYDQSGKVLKGVGKYCTDLGQGTASYEMFGDGRDGAMPGSGNLDNANGFAAGSINGTVGATSIAVTDRHAIARINSGDVVLLHQTRGSGAGQWELNKAADNFTGSGTFALQNPLKYSYVSNSGNEKAQILRVPQYSTCNVTGTVTPLAAWNGDWGGIFAVMCNGTMNLTGAISASGYGFRGGIGYNQPNTVDRQGEGTASFGGRSQSANGNGGGGGHEEYAVQAWTGGGGGGNGATGGNGSNRNGAPVSYGGIAAGNAELSRAVFGGGGGGYTTQTGGNGGGFIFISSKIIEANGTIAVSGGNGTGQGGGSTGSGGGAGGSILIKTKNANLGSSLSAVGGSGGRSSYGTPGGNGGLGRIRVESCEVLPLFSANPSASTQKLDCYAAEQLETTPYTTTRLYLPDAVNGSQSYLAQYARRFVFAASGQQISSMRLNRRVYGGASLDLLVSNAGAASGSLSLCLDLGNDGICDYNHSGSTTFPATLEASGLAEALNNYLLGRNDVAWGDPVDVPVRLIVDRAADIMLTNLALTPLGAKTRFVRLNADNYETVALGLEFRQSGVASGPLAFTVDVGANGTVDWSYAGTPTFPARITSPDLAEAINAYLAGRSGMVDLPLRITPSPALDLSVVTFNASSSNQPDLVPLAPTISQSRSAASVVEGDLAVLTSMIENQGSGASGPLGVTFYVDIPGPESGQTRKYYIGSTFLPDIPAGGAMPASIEWNTLGFPGELTVNVIVDPFERVAESNKNNNTSLAVIPILTRPDLTFTDLTLSNPEPMAGETVQVRATLANQGQTPAGSQSVALYRDNPDGGGASVETQNLASLPGQTETTVQLSWTPTEPGLHRLFLRADRDGQIDESDTNNNDRWVDVYVGFASPLGINSGMGGDTAYSPSQGFGAVDTGLADEMGSCGDAPHQTFRRDPSGEITYRFDHLLPGHFYHLDLVMYECGQNAGRQQRVKVDGMEIAGPIDLGSGEIQRLSLLLDPALYANRTISVTVSVDGTGGAILNQIDLVAVDYRYADAGGANDPAYPSGARPYGFLNGVPQSPWGSLPFQSLRENQNGDEVSYRFDALDPDKDYQVHFSFFLGSGNNRVQTIWVDDVPLTGDFTLVAGQRVNQRIDLPKAVYADGSITVSVRRSDGASTGAMINEIALEEITQARAVTCAVTATPSWSATYGTITVAGQPAPIGTVVTAENPRGDVVGCFVVDAQGEYGLMTIYGEDTSASPAIPGMRVGEPVIFRVNGVMAVASPLFTWQNDRDIHAVNLAAGQTQSQYSLLRPNWNLISTRMAPPVPLIEIALQSIAQKYCLVLGQEGIHDCSLPAPFRSLKDVEAGKAYYVRVEGGASVNLVMEGTPLAGDTAFNLEPGWNWVGYLPQSSLPIADALASIEGKLVRAANGAGQIYVPGLSASTLTEMAPGQGYLLFLSEAATLTYPATAAANLGNPDQSKVQDEPASVHCGGVEPTPYFTALYGSVRINDREAPAGTVVQAITPRGEVAGCFTVTNGGEYGFLTIFGADGTADGVPGFLTGEAIELRVNGSVVEMEAPLLWGNDKDIHLHDLDATVEQFEIYLPFTNR